MKSSLDFVERADADLVVIAKTGRAAGATSSSPGARCASRTCTPRSSWCQSSDQSPNDGPTPGVRLSVPPGLEDLKEPGARLGVRGQRSTL